MNNKRTERNVTKRTTPTRAPRATRKTVVEEAPQRSFNFFRVSESYTSLILGAFVVIFTSLILIAFLRSRADMPVPQSTQDISTALKVGPTISLDDANSDTRINAGAEAVTPTVNPTVTKAPTPPVTQVVKPTAIPTKVAAPTKVVAKATVAPTTRPVVTPTTVAQTRPGQVVQASTYVTKAGDDLWKIAERYYNSGYNWVDIVKANNIIDANVIQVGAKLTIPATEKKVATVTAAPTQTPMANLGKPAQDNQARTYTVKAGDDLWDVAVSIYKNGYRWTEIAKANNLSNPHIIHSGNVLKIP